MEAVVRRQDLREHGQRLLAAILLVGGDQHDVLASARPLAACVGQPERALGHGVHLRRALVLGDTRLCVRPRDLVHGVVGLSVQELLTVPRAQASQIELVHVSPRQGVQDQGRPQIILGQPRARRTRRGSISASPRELRSREH